LSSSSGGVAFRRRQEIVVSYKDREVGRHRLDLIVAGEIVVELEAVTDLNEVHLAQNLSYLKSSKIPVGLVLNFGKATLESRRVVL
jgi:GxxExxY protein